MDISLQIVLNPATHTSEPGVYKLGDITNVHPVAPLCTWTGTEYKVNGGVGSRRTGFIHITGVPTALPIAAIKTFLSDSWQGAVVDNNPTMIERRVWKVDTLQLTAQQQQELADNREITVAWNDIKAQVYNKVQDRAINDGDV